MDVGFKAVQCDLSTLTGVALFGKCHLKMSNVNYCPDYFYNNIKIVFRVELLH